MELSFDCTTTLVIGTGAASCSFVVDAVELVACGGELGPGHQLGDMHAFATEEGSTLIWSEVGGRQARRWRSDG
ncbi:MAG: hypothetical protein V3V08_08175 [Nannocystaceae bacterium]